MNCPSVVFGLSADIPRASIVCLSDFPRDWMDRRPLAKRTPLLFPGGPGPPWMEETSTQDGREVGVEDVDSASIRVKKYLGLRD